MSLAELQAWLLADLRAELTARRPRLIATIESVDARNEAEIERFVRENLDFPVLQPWTNLISGAVSLRLGLTELAFAAQALRTAPDGVSTWFFQEIIPLVASSCFERLEYIVRRLGRGGLVDGAAAKAIEGRVVKAREEPQFAPLRHYVAHGPHLGLDAGGWLDVAGQGRFWELAALRRCA